MKNYTLDLSNITHLGDFYRFTRKNGTNVRICSLYQDENKYYIADVIPNTIFRKHYFYVVSKSALEKFFKTKETKHLKPRGQVFVHTVHTFDKVIEKSERVDATIKAFSFFNENYECMDEEVLSKYFLTENKTNLNE